MYVFHLPPVVCHSPDTPIFSDDHKTTAKRAVWQAFAEAEILAQVNTHREQSSSAQW